MLFKGRFDGKVALVTGGGTGVGAAVAQRIAAEGGKVVLMGRRPGPLEEVAKAFGGLVVAGDAADGKDVAQAVDAAKKAYGHLDILIANAGGHGVGPTTEMPDEVWHLATRLNLDTAFASARGCLPELIRNKGNIVIVASIAALFAGPQACGYVTMKHALLGLTKSLARDYGRLGVRTNAICPAWIRTVMADEQMQVLVQAKGLASIEEAYRLVTKDVPAGRASTPEEVANVICFLASDEAAMMNGAFMTVDGGASAVDLPTLPFYDAPPQP